MEVGGEDGHASDVTAWPSQAGNQSNGHRVRAEDPDDRHGRGQRFERASAERTITDDDIGRGLDQLGSQGRNSVRPSPRKVEVELDRLIFDPAQLFQFCAKCIEQRRCLAWRRGKDADDRHLPLLCMGEDRPRECCRAAEEREDLTPSHVRLQPRSMVRTGTTLRLPGSNTGRTLDNHALTCPGRAQCCHRPFARWSDAGVEMARSAISTEGECFVAPFSLIATHPKRKSPKFKELSCTFSSTSLSL